MQVIEMIRKNLNFTVNLKFRFSIEDYSRGEVMNLWISQLYAFLVRG